MKNPDDSLEVRELLLSLEELAKSKPPNPWRKPTDSERKALRKHKEAVMDFWKQLPQELSDVLQSHIQKTKQARKAEKKAFKPPPPKPPKIQLTAKPTPVQLGWHAGEGFVFTHVIPFLSHTR